MPISDNEFLTSSGMTQKIFLKSLDPRSPLWTNRLRSPKCRRSIRIPFCYSIAFIRASLIFPSLTSSSIFFLNKFVT
jgi:hypothetical protein